MFDPFSQQGAGELNVLKRHLCGFRFIPAGY
ncbi:hypothetical protein ACVME5_001371 [Bradyrhizobium liaoningense]